MQQKKIKGKTFSLYEYMAGDANNYEIKFQYVNEIGDLATDVTSDDYGIVLNLRPQDYTGDVLSRISQNGYFFSGLNESGSPVFIRKNKLSQMGVKADSETESLEKEVLRLKKIIRIEKNKKKLIKESRRYRVGNTVAKVYSPLRRVMGMTLRGVFELKARKHKKVYDYASSEIDKIIYDKTPVNERLVKIKNILEANDEVCKKEEFFWYIKDGHPISAAYVGWVLWREREGLDDIQRTVRSLLTYSGSLYDLRDFLLEVQSRLPEGSPTLTRRIDDEIDKYENGFTFPERGRRCENNIVSLYLLHNSLPYDSGGYAMRSHGLITSIGSLGIYKVIALSRPGYPSDHKKYISKKLPNIIPRLDVVDDVIYYRSDQSVRKSSLTLTEYIDVYSENIKKLIKEKNVSIIHAASNFPNAFAAIQAARIAGIKSVYEVRGLWEVTRLSRQEGWDNTDQYQYMAKMEADACKAADAVITITHALKELMISRGVPEGKITVVPNCVHTDRFLPLEKDIALADDLGISNYDVVIGYVGSIVNYEGLDDLLKACQLLVKDGVSNFKLLVVGDGAVLDDLKKMSSKLGIDDNVIFTGRVPYDEVNKYYSLVDITPFPRKPYKVCEIVSPLKPFEALATGKAVVVSSCEALIEIIKDGSTGLVFEKGSVEDFFNTMKRLIEDPELRRELGENGRKWVLENRDWSHGGDLVRKVYDDLYSTP